MRLQEQIAMDDTISHQVGNATLRHSIHFILTAIFFIFFVSFAAHNLLTVPNTGTSDAKPRGVATFGLNDWQRLPEEFTLLHTHCRTPGSTLSIRMLQ